MSKLTSACIAGALLLFATAGLCQTGGNSTNLKSVSSNATRGSYRVTHTLVSKSKDKETYRVTMINNTAKPFSYWVPMAGPDVFPPQYFSAVVMNKSFKSPQIVRCGKNPGSYPGRLSLDGERPVAFGSGIMGDIKPGHAAEATLYLYNLPPGENRIEFVFQPEGTTQ